jgi:hypothetical protein
MFHAYEKHAVPLTDVHLMGVPLIGVHSIGVPLLDVHSIGVYLMGVPLTPTGCTPVGYMPRREARPYHTHPRAISMTYPISGSGRLTP